MASLLEKVESRRVLIAAVVLYLIAEALDFITSILGMAYLRGSHETSIFLRDPHTLKFLATQALWVKSLHTLIRVVLPSLALWAGTQSYLLASLLFWATTYSLLYAVWSNFIMLILFH
jgi:hypothetical protein